LKVWQNIIIIYCTIESKKIFITTFLVKGGGKGSVEFSR